MFFSFFFTSSAWHVSALFSYFALSLENLPHINCWLLIVCHYIVPQMQRWQLRNGGQQCDCSLRKGTKNPWPCESDRVGPPQRQFGALFLTFEQFSGDFWQSKSATYLTSSYEHCNQMGTSSREQDSEVPKFGQGWEVWCLVAVVVKLEFYRFEICSKYRATNLATAR